MNEDCRHCYAERVAMRFSGPGQPYQGLIRMVVEEGVARPAGWNGRVQVIEDHLMDPLHWQRPRLVFVNSMSDLFHESLPDEAIDRIVAVMALADHHTFQVLTKRPARMAEYLADRRRQILDASCETAAAVRRDAPVLHWPLPNVWWGASMGHQKAMETLMPALQACRPNAAVLWASLEPLIGPLAGFGAWMRRCAHGPVVQCPICRNSEGVPALDWVVAGGESGPEARPCHPDWIRAVRDDCQRAGVAFHFKQWGEWGRVTHYAIGGHYLADNGQVYQPRTVMGAAGGNLAKIGKKAAGRLLDGREWNDWPRGWTPGPQTGA